MNLFEQFKNSPEKEYSPENLQNNIKEYLEGLKDLVEEKQLEFDNEENKIKQEKLTQELEELRGQITELEETLAFMQEAGDELEIEVGE